MVDEIHDRLHGIHLVAASYCFDVFLAVEVQLVYLVDQQIRRNIILIENDGVALCFEGSGIQQLVSAAAGSRQRDENVRLFQCEELADRVGPGTGDDDVCHGEDILLCLIMVSDRRNSHLHDINSLRRSLYPPRFS